jgi:hypothetical protein
MRRTPVSIVDLDGARYIVAAFEKAAWVANVRVAGEATLSRGNRVERVRLVELPTDARGPVLRAFLEQVPGGRRFFASAQPGDVVAAADRYPVFQVVER